MVLIWCGPDREDMDDNFELEENEMYDIDLIMEKFELYCELICIFVLPGINSDKSSKGKMK